MLALFRLSRFLLTLISKISLWFLWQVQKSSHDRWFPVSSFEGPELRPTMVKRRLAVRPISMRQLPLLLPLGHKEILVSQVPIIQGRGTKSKLAFYVSNRYDTILILCFCMPIKRDRDKPAWILRLRLLLSAPFCSSAMESQSQIESAALATQLDDRFISSHKRTILVRPFDTLTSQAASQSRNLKLN